MVNEENIKPTLKKPMSNQSKKFEKNFDSTMKKSGVNLNEVDKLLTEKEQSLKKRIFNLSKMEALVHSDPKLSAVYAEMSENGEEKYGYHHNETIMNMIFNEYILHSSKYIQKYKQAIPKEKKRRDKSGINKLKEKGEEKMKKRKNNTHESVNESFRDNLENTKEEALRVSKEEGVAQHVNKISDDVYEVSDWFDSDSTVVSYENGNLMETTTAASSGAYTGPSAWSKSGEPISKPIFKMGTIVEEGTNYLIDSKGFEKYVETLNEESDMDYIENNSDAYGNLKNMDKENIDIIKTDIKNQTIEEDHLHDREAKISYIVNGYKELEPQYSDTENENLLLTMLNDLNDDMLDSIYVNVEEKLIPVNEESETMFQDNPSSMAFKPNPIDQSIGVDRGFGSVAESKIIDKLDEELKAYSIHHDKLKQMNEDRKPSTLVMKDRLGSENTKNFKSDMKNSGTGEIINIEKELQWKEQQTDVGKDPQKLSSELEKKSLKVNDGKAFDNVGNSTNDKGNEIPKRNLTDEELDEVEMYRKGLGDYVFDNEPDKKFEDRMKGDMGDKLYKQRQDKIKFAADAPMYNKDTQPVDDGTEKVQFNKEKSGWNERKGIKESVIGKFNNENNKKCFIDFKLSDVANAVSEEHVKDLFMLDMNGLGNTTGNNWEINEEVNEILSKYDFYTDGEKIVALDKKTDLNESVKNKNVQVNESLDKMKHLLNYNPNNYTNTKKTKKNRGF